MLRNRFLSALGALVLGGLLFPLSTPCAPAGRAPSSARQDKPVEAGDESTPQQVASAFLDACRAQDYALAGTFLEPPSGKGWAPDQAAEYARHLKVVLDQTVWVPIETLSTAPEGDREDGLPADLEKIVTIERARGSVSVLLHRSRTEDGWTWKFSAATVARIPALYDEFGYGALGRILPETFFASFLEIQLWQWLGLLVLIVGAYVLSWIAVWTLHSLVRPLVARTSSDLDDQVLDLTAKPLRFLAWIGLFYLGLFLLRLSVPVREFMTGMQKGLAVIAVAWLFLRVVDLLAAALRARLKRDGKASAVAVLPLGEKSLKVVVLGFAVVAMMQNLGFNVTGLLAGLGVGGLALALAAQKTVENLFGGVSMILDQPVRVGDFCKWGDRVGTVEDIGLRSTKLRTLDRTVVSIPNADFAYMQLENFARRDKIRFYTKLGLRYETTPDQMRWVLAEMRKLLLAHPRVEPDPARVRFIGYGDFSLDLEIFAFVNTSDFNEYLGIQEDLLLRLMDIVNDSGTGFAFPSSTTYLARDGGNDAELTRQAEARVAELRAAGKLPFPDYAPAFKTEVDDTLDFPPKGSVAHAGQA